VDVCEISPFLKSKDGFIRLCAARVVAAKGKVEDLVNMALVETNKGNLMEVLRLIKDSDSAISYLVGFLKSDDSYVREATINMYRRVKREDMLLSLVFDQDEDLANRIKSYING
jgi:hypothetical protein